MNFATTIAVFDRPTTLDDREETTLSQVIHALLVEDSEADVELIQRELVGSQLELDVADSLAAAMNRLDSNGLDAVLLDLTLPDSDGIDTLARLRAKAPHLAVVVLTGRDDEDLALEAVQEGAQDYLVKGDYNRRSLVRAVRYAIERQRAEQERELLVGAITHDLRNPLGAIVMGADLLLRRGDLGAEHAKPVSRISQSAHRMTRLIGQLLDFAKSRVGGIPLTRAETRLADITQTVIDEVETVYPGTSVKLSIEGPCAGHWDSDRLIQVVQNLVTNALQHGSLADPVTIVLKQSGDRVMLDVTNRGDTISPNILKHIFDLFRRPPQSGKRLGLGLYITRQIVAAHEGTVSARSEGGQTTFSVRLPVKPSDGSRTVESLP